MPPAEGGPPAFSLWRWHLRGNWKPPLLQLMINLSPQDEHTAVIWVAFGMTGDVEMTKPGTTIIFPIQDDVISRIVVGLSDVTI